LKRISTSGDSAIEMPKIEIIGLLGIPDVRGGDDIASIIMDACRLKRIHLKDGDILTVNQKIISKSEKNIITLNDVKPSKFASQLASKLKKEPEMMEVILGESKKIIKIGKRSVIVQTKHGFVCANAGVDNSNVYEGQVTLLPSNSDKSAHELRQAIKERLGIEVAIVITDTFGRPWREGQVDVAIGVSGLKPIMDYRGKNDKYGNKLFSTEIAIADELASAGELVKGKSSNIPVAIIRGFAYKVKKGSVRTLIRKTSEDLFL